MKNVPPYNAGSPEYLEWNQFVVDLQSPESMASVLQYQIDHVNSVIDRIKNHGISYGSIEDDNFIDQYTEEDLADALAKYPHLYPLISKYIRKVVLPASQYETASGPWADSDSIFGQYIVPMLADSDEQYEDLLKTFVTTNVEIQFSPRFQEWFSYVQTDDDQEDDDDDDDWEDDDDEEQVIEIDISEAIFDTAAINEMTDTLLACKQNKKEIKAFLNQRNQYQYGLINPAYNGVDLIYCNSKSSLILGEDMQSCYVNMSTNQTVLNFDQKAVEIKDAPAEFFEKIKACVEAHGQIWCDLEKSMAQNNNYANIKHCKGDEIVEIDEALADFRAKPSTNQLTVQDVGVEMIQWYNNEKIADLLNTYYTTCTLTGEEDLAFNQFISRQTKYPTVFLQIMPHMVSVICSRQDNDDYEFQFFSVMIQGVYCLNITSGSTSTSKFDLSAEFKAAVQDIIDEANLLKTASK